MSRRTAVQVYLHDDVALAKEAARAGMALYMRLPYYNRLMHNSGFQAEAKAGSGSLGRGDTAALAAAVSDRVVDAWCYMVPPLVAANGWRRWAKAALT